MKENFMKRMLIPLGANKSGGLDVDQPEREESLNEKLYREEMETLTNLKQPPYSAVPGCGQCEEPTIDPNPHLIPDPEFVPGYGDLRRILDSAYKQAAFGKGKERHGTKGEAWTEQPIIRHQRAYGIGFALGQAAKKMEEAMALPPERARFELLGAIVYVAAAYRFLEEQDE